MKDCAAGDTSDASDTSDAGDTSDTSDTGTASAESILKLHNRGTKNETSCFWQVWIYSRHFTFSLIDRASR